MGLKHNNPKVWDYKNRICGEIVLARKLNLFPKKILKNYKNCIQK